MKFIDRASDALGTLAAWLFFAIGGIVVYEIVLRWLFNAPTKWSLEVTEWLQLWATYLGAAYVLRHRELIRVDIVLARVSTRARRWLDGFALLCIAAFSAVAIYHGSAIVADSVRLGRRTASMLALPQWAVEIAVPLGFTLLLAQSVIELARLRTTPQEPPR